MPDAPKISPTELRDAFTAYERPVRVTNYKVGCLLAFIFMLAGASLDWFVYGSQQLWPFFKLRMLCSGLLAVVWVCLHKGYGLRFYRVLGFLVAFLPMAFISWMIYASASGGAPAYLAGANSPYYAGLNLVMLGAAILLRWTLLDSIMVFALSLITYLAACYLSPAAIDRNILFNNVYFLFVTGVFIIAGSWVYNSIRFREFVLRFELDKNKKALEQTNQTLDTQNKELAVTIEKLAEAESQLVQSEKMASLGVMSAGIIHEINNPLNYATTGLYTLRQKSKYIAPEQQADFADILKDVEEGVGRVKNIVSDLRMFTHPNTDSHDQVEVAEVIEPVLRFLSAELKDSVHIERQWPEHQAVTANKQKLIHVFTNLLQNSVDALKTKTFTDEKPTIWIEGRVENDRSLLTVRDNGPGIESKHLNKIFDPFYTTKDVGEGMGLGLSICYRIMHESGGRISVRTEPGKFCEFTLEFSAKE